MVTAATAEDGAGLSSRQRAGIILAPWWIRLVRGRNFRPDEEGVAIVSEAAARALWPHQDALGQSLPWSSERQTVIGVARDASTAYVGIPEPLEFYLPPSRSNVPDSGLREGMLVQMMREDGAIQVS